MNFEQARSNMVLNQLRANRIRDIDLIEKIEDFPREHLFPKDLKHLSCLLYTSPSPRDLSTSRMPSSA